MMEPNTDAVRFSHLKKIALSPAHYLAGLQEPSTDTPRLRMGRLVHSLVLGGSGFVVYDGDRRGKVWKEFQAEHESCEIVTAKEAAVAERARDAVLNDPRAAELLAGQHEVPMEWQQLGRRCRTLGIDVLGERWTTELKTCFTAAPWRFPGHALRMQYHTQVAWIHDGLRARDRFVDAGYVVAVEMFPPFAVTTWQLTPRALEQGSKTWRLWLERLIACESSNEWPGYVQSTLDLDVPDDDGFTLKVGGETVDFDADELS